jgi:hypothetical protein
VETRLSGQLPRPHIVCIVFSFECLNEWSATQVPRAALQVYLTSASAQPSLADLFRLEAVAHEFIGLAGFGESAQPTEPVTHVDDLGAGAVAEPLTVGHDECEDRLCNIFAGLFLLLFLGRAFALVRFGHLVSDVGITLR